MGIILFCFCNKKKLDKHTACSLTNLHDSKCYGCSLEKVSTHSTGVAFFLLLTGGKFGYEPVILLN